MARRDAKREIDVNGLYGSAGVARILEVPLWRVHNIVDGDAFRIDATVHIGSGKGSRRYFDKEAILKVGLAIELTNIGLTPVMVGDIVSTGKYTQQNRFGCFTMDIESLKSKIRKYVETQIGELDS